MNNTEFNPYRSAPERVPYAVIENIKRGEAKYHEIEYIRLDLVDSIRASELGALNELSSARKQISALLKALGEQI